MYNFYITYKNPKIYSSSSTDNFENVVLYFTYVYINVQSQKHDKTFNFVYNIIKYKIGINHY